MRLHQENLPEYSESQAGTPPETPGASRLSGKHLLLASVIGAIALLFAATRFPAIRSAWAGLIDKPQSLVADPPARRTAVAAPLASENRSPAPPSPTAALSPEEQAQRIWTDLEKASLGAALDDWSNQHPEIPCRRFNGTLWSQAADVAWSERCSPGRQPEDAHWLFYAFELEEPIVPRLEQFDATTPSLPPDSLTTVHALLESRLAARFGPGEDTSPKIVRTRETARPPNLRWQTPDLEIQLFLSEFDPQSKQGRLRLEARDRTLLDALKEDERLKQFAASYIYEAGSGIDKQLSEKLKSEFPGPAAMLMKQRPDADPQQVAEALKEWKQQFRASETAGQAGVRAAVIAIPQSNWNARDFKDAIVRLLAAAKSAPPERQPILLLAADRLLGRLPWVVQNDNSQAEHWPEWRAQLEKSGVTFDNSGANPGGLPWSYTSSLLKRVWTDFPQTEWGEHAFVLLLSQGFDTGVECAAGSDQFHTVIPQGLLFLEKHPNSPYRLDVQLAVAQAYETLWSLSQAPARGESEDEYSTVEPAKYQEGAGAARQKAIAVYETLVQTSPQSDAAAYARRQLPRLKLGADTGQRRFYCEVGD